MKFLEFPDDLRWLVCDLDDVADAGRKIAAERSVSGLSFTTKFADADNVDLLIASGSMHYLQKPLSLKVGELRAKPKLVLINRTPLTDGPAFATVQDTWAFRGPCMVYNKADLIREFEQIDYKLTGEWQAAELSLPVPFHPKHPVLAYSGLMFERC